tara:strand:+ start:196 stop:1227 length:1032 start_codon:yes stop_codon:yes gene_type:complete
MATFKNQVQGLSQISIGASSAPTEDELSQFLSDAIKDITNKVIAIRPSEAVKFSADNTDDNNSGITITGAILNVARRNGSSTDLRPATPIDANVRYLATQKSSLHYRSALSPGFYILNKKLFVIPAPEDANTQVHLSQVGYPSATHNDSISGVAFPAEYEHLIIQYATAMSCLAAAADIQNNMPTKVTKLNSPVFSIDDVDLPSTPTYISKPLDFTLSKVTTHLLNEDFEAADKEMAKLDKAIEQFKSLGEEEVRSFTNELEVFKSNLDNRVKNADRNVQQKATEYRSELYKHAQEVGQYQQEIQESLAKYKWFIEQYMALMGQYNGALGISARREKQEKGDE